MKLLTVELLRRFREVGNQEKEKDPIVIAKFFAPVGAATWYAIEYNEKRREFFGYADLTGETGEFGYFSLDELESIKFGPGLGIERDLYCGEKRLSEFVKSF